MSESKNKIEAMHARLEKMAKREQMLIAALDEALSRADRKLLDDVRNITADHEARRTIILTELQTLADRIGMLPAPAPEMRVETIEYEAPVVPEPATPPPPAAPATPARGGDWRTAARKIVDDLDYHLNNGTAVYDSGGQPS